MKRTLAFTTAVLMSLAVSGVSLAQENPFVGTWKLNVVKSKYVGEQRPKSATRTVVAQGDGLEITYEGISDDGSTISYRVTSHLDGTEAPYSGRQPFGADSVAIKRVDANTLTSVSTRAGKKLFTTKWIVSKDGKVATLNTIGINAEGKPISVTTVWYKQSNDTAHIVDPPHWKQPNTP